MKTIKLSKDFDIILEEEYYKWNAEADMAFIMEAAKHTISIPAFYTDYRDKYGVKRLQRSYDRIRFTKGDFPKGCFIVRSNMLRMAQEDKECGEYSDLDLFIRLTEIGPMVHLPVACFTELKEKKYSTGPELVLKRAEERLAQK